MTLRARYFCELRKDLFFRSRDMHKDALYSLVQFHQHALNTVTEQGMGRVMARGGWDFLPFFTKFFTNCCALFLHRLNVAKPVKQ